MNIPLDEVIYFDCITTTAATGAATDADSTPTFAVYEEATDTDIGVGGNLTKRTSLTGNYRGTFTLSAANGFEVGKWYSIIGSATVGGVAGKAVLKNFRVVAAEATAGYIETNSAKWNNLATVALPLIPTVAGRTLDVSAGGEAGVDWANVGSPTTTVGLTNTTVGVVTLTNTATTVTNQLTAAAIATGIWQDATAGDFTVSGSIGKALYVSNVAPGGSGGHMISGTNSGTTTLGALTVTGATTLTGAVTGTNASNNLTGVHISLASGTSDSGTTTTMVDSARTEADTDYWKGQLIVFTSGNIAGQARYITGFTPGTDTITFAPATTQAVSTQTYEIWPTADFLRPIISGNTIQVNSSGQVQGETDAAVDTALGSIAAAIVVIDDFLDTEVAAIKAKTDLIPASPASTTNITAGTITTVTDVTNAVKTTYAMHKNTAFSNFEFLMTDSTNHAAATGKTVTATRSIDGGAFASCTNSVSEVSAGIYKINLAAADLNGDCVTLKFTATDCDPTLITLILQT